MVVEEEKGRGRKGKAEERYEKVRVMWGMREKE